MTIRRWGGWVFLLLLIAHLTNSGWQIYLLLLYSCSKILVYMIISNRTINTQIWCLLLDQVCPNEHHLPVPFGGGWVGGHPPHCSSHQLWVTIWGGVGSGWEVLLFLIAHLTNSGWPFGGGMGRSGGPHCPPHCSSHQL